MMLEGLDRRVAEDARLVARGRLIDVVMLVGIGPDTWRLRIHAGRVVELDKGPFVMPSCTFAVKASREEWERFAARVPPPGSHDLFAMLKRRALAIEGDLHPFMANLFYFKALFAKLRLQGDAEPGAAMS